MRLSGSRVDLLLACGYAFNGQKWPRDESGDAARIGNAVHYVAAKTVNGSDAPLVTLVADALASEKIAADSDLAAQVIDLIPGDFAAPDGARAEVAYAWDYETGAVRELGVDIGRDYSIAPTEIAGTADIVHVGDRVLIADWKTGMKPPRAQGNGQLMFLAMCATRLASVDSARLEIRHVRPGGDVWIDSAEVSRFDLDVFESELSDAIMAAPSSAPNPGAHCAGKYCPLRAICPATVATVDPAPAYPLALYEAGEIQGDAHAEWLLHRIESAAELLVAVKEKVKQYVDAHGPIELSDGRKYGPYVVVRESIDGPKDKLLEAGIPEGLIEYSVSKGAVEKRAKDQAERGKGAAAARAAIERLRDAGCVKESSFVQYEARK